MKRKQQRRKEEHVEWINNDKTCQLKHVKTVLTFFSLIEFLNLRVMKLTWLAVSCSILLAVIAWAKYLLTLSSGSGGGTVDKLKKKKKKKKEAKNNDIDINCYFKMKLSCTMFCIHTHGCRGSHTYAHTYKYA